MCVYVCVCVCVCVSVSVHGAVNVRGDEVQRNGLRVDTSGDRPLKSQRVAFCNNQYMNTAEPALEYHPYFVLFGVNRLFRRVNRLFSVLHRVLSGITCSTSEGQNRNSDLQTRKEKMRGCSVQCSVQCSVCGSTTAHNEEELQRSTFKIPAQNNR